MRVVEVVLLVLLILLDFLVILLFLGGFFSDFCKFICFCGLVIFCFGLYDFINSLDSICDFRNFIIFFCDSLDILKFWFFLLIYCVFQLVLGEQKQKYKDYQKKYKRNMTDEQKQKYIEYRRNMTDEQK